MIELRKKQTLQVVKTVDFGVYLAEDMNADELIAFLKQKGKFKPQEEGFAFDETKRCNHH